MIYSSFIRLRKDGSVYGTIIGDLPNKSNSRRLFGGISIKSQGALDFVKKVKIAALFIGNLYPLEGATNQTMAKRGIPFLVLTARVYGKDFMRDLDVELLPDALEAAGVIKNDRAIRQKHYYWELDTKNPRTEFEIGFLSTSTK
jgi:hypothetical protein